MKQNLFDLLKPGKPSHYYGSAHDILQAPFVTVSRARSGLDIGTQVKVTDINLQTYIITTIYAGEEHLFPASYLELEK